MKQAKSIGRANQREIKAKFDPAIKILSQHVHQTGQITNDFLGYKVPAGEIKDRLGREWQIQIHATCSKKLKIRKNEIVPMIRKWAIGMKLRVIAKYIVDWANK